MSNLATLKKKAAEFEQKRQFDRALEAYEEVLRLQDGTEDADVALHNRAGDLQLRLGRTSDALRSYERAVDLYSDRGFLNNAIALCNKILRQDPLRAAVHLKLGRASAIKGFRSDARRHLVQYADLMQRAGRLDEALAAIAELVEIGTDMDDLRLLLAEHLERQGRAADAIAQLERVAESADRAGRSDDAAAMRDRIRGLDPDYAGVSTGTTAEWGIDPAAAHRAADHLVLIEPTAYEPDRARHSPAAGMPTVPVAPAAPSDDAPLELMRGAAADVEPSDAGYAMPDLEPTSFGDTYEIEPTESDEAPHDATRAGEYVSSGADTRAADEAGSGEAAPSLLDPADLVIHANDDVEAEDGEDVAPVELTFIDVDEPPTRAVDLPVADFDMVVDERADAAEPTIEAPGRSVRPVVPTAAVQRASFPTPNAVRPVPSTPISSRPVVEAPAASSGYIDLGDLLREDEGPRSTRMVTEERAPEGDEQVDFSVMLRKFTQGVAEHVDEEDYDSHYDLGIAYKEMGLVDEAIAAFQRALRGTARRPRAYEALGQCFLERGQHSVAMAVLQRAAQESNLADEQLVGVYYLLGRTAEAMNQRDDAVRYYERVLAVDITFSDVADRMGLVSQVPR